MSCGNELQQCPSLLSSDMFLYRSGGVTGRTTLPTVIHADCLPVAEGGPELRGAPRGVNQRCHFFHAADVTPGNEQTDRSRTQPKRLRPRQSHGAQPLVAAQEDGSHVRFSRGCEQTLVNQQTMWNSPIPFIGVTRQAGVHGSFGIEFRSP